MRSTSGSRTCSIIARIFCAPRPRIEIGMDAQHLVDLAADRDHRIERRHRLLKDHRHGGGAQLPQRRSLAVSSSSPTSLMLPPEGTSAPFCSSPITVSDVTDLPDPLSPTTHSVSPSCTCRETPSMMRVPLRLLAEADDEIVDVENDGVRARRRIHLPPSRCFMRGSSASRAASPIRLTLRIAIDSNRPGQKISDGLIWK